MERKLFDFIKREFGREHNIERDNKRYMAALDFCRQLSFADPESLYNLMYYIYGGAIERPNINLKTIDDNIEKIDEIKKMSEDAHTTYELKDKLSTYENNRIVLRITFPWTQYGLYTKYRNREITSHLKASLQGKKYKPRREINWRPPEIPRPSSVIKCKKIRKELAKFPDFGDSQECQITSRAFEYKIDHIINKDKAIKELIQKANSSEKYLQEILAESNRVKNAEHEYYCLVLLFQFEYMLNQQGKSVDVNELRQNLLSNKNLVNPQAVENALNYFENNQESFKANHDDADKFINNLEFKWQNYIEQKDFLNAFESQYSLSKNNNLNNDMYSQL